MALGRRSPMSFYEITDFSAFKTLIFLFFFPSNVIIGFSFFFFSFYVLVVTRDTCHRRYLR